MQATRFEFEQRFWVIGAIFFVGFSLNWLDHSDRSNFAVALVGLIAPNIDREGAAYGFALRSVFFIAAGLVFLAAMLRTWATAYLRTEVVHDQRQHSDHLVADGPYRFVRNPLYLAAWLMCIGVATMASRFGFVFIVIAFGLFMYRLIMREEVGLLESQGESYRKYMKAVPRVIPALYPQVPRGDRRPRWGQAFVGELFFWLIAAGMALVAITLDARLAGLIFVGSMVVYFVSVGVLKKRAQRAGIQPPPGESL